MLFKHFPPPPKMSRNQYLRYRLRLLLLSLMWLTGISIAIFFWDRLHVVIKGLLAIFGLVFVPDIGIVEQLFISYEKYTREGLRC